VILILCVSLFFCLESLGNLSSCCPFCLWPKTSYSISCIDIIVCHVRSVTSVSVHLSIVVRLFVRFIGNCIVSVCVRCCD